MAIILPTLALIMSKDKTTRQLLDTNPMSLIVTPTAQWMGMSNVIAVAADGNRHLTFASPDFGLRAGCISLYASCSRPEISTLEALLRRWTPNNETLFVRGGYYEQEFGLTLKDPVPWAHISRMAEIVRAIVRIERGSDYVERHEKMLTINLRTYLFKGAMRHCEDMKLELAATSRVLQYVTYLTRTGRAYPGKKARREVSLTLARQSDQPAERVALFTLAVVDPTNKLLRDENVRLYKPKMDPYGLLTRGVPQEHSVHGYANFWADDVSKSKTQQYRAVFNQLPTRLVASLPPSEGSSYTERVAREVAEASAFNQRGSNPPRVTSVTTESIGHAQPWKPYDRLSASSPLYLV